MQSAEGVPNRTFLPGATAAQIIPEIAKEVSHLTIFQRTPNWVVPRLDIPIYAPFRGLFKFIPPLLWGFRAFIMDFREAFYSAITNPGSKTSHMIREACLKMMKMQLPNRPDLWEKLTPNYPPGCKRVIISDDYFLTLTRENVTLETGRVERVTEKGIIVDGKEHEFDVIVLATGFRTVEFMHPIKVYGVSGKSLSEIWSKGARALYGVTVESLPNFGMLYGPNTNLGHNSIILMIEAQARYILALIQAVLQARQRGSSLALTPNAERLAEFNDQIQATLRKTSFAHPSCQSWYKTKDGLITNNWSGTVVDYQKLLSKVNWDDFNIEIEGKTSLDLQKKKIQNIGRVREETLIGTGRTIVVVALMSVIGTLAIKAPHLLPRIRI